MHLCQLQLVSFSSFSFFKFNLILIDFDSISNNDWHTEGLYVRIKISNEDESIHVGMVGIIQSLSVSFFFFYFQNSRIIDLFFLE